MQEVIQQHNFSTLTQDYVETKARKASFLVRFLRWCDTQEESRFLWLGISLFGLIGGIVPLTLFAIISFANNNFALWMVVCAVNVPVLALNLAAQGPKVTLPTLFIALIVDLLTIAFCVAIFLIR